MTGTECSHLLLISHFYFIAQACMPDHRQLSAKGQPLLAPTLHASLVVLQAHPLGRRKGRSPPKETVCALRDLQVPQTLLNHPYQEVYREVSEGKGDLYVSDML